MMSKQAVEDNTAKWTSNISLNTKRRANLPEVKNSLEELCRMPLKKAIIGRYLGLHDEMVYSKDRIKKISVELNHLWSNLNFPAVSLQRIEQKIQILVNLYVKYRKRQNPAFEKILSELFDITKGGGEWLNREDKELYELQVQSNGKVGYTTKRIAPISTIHPSKRIQRISENSEISMALNDIYLEGSEDESSDGETTGDFFTPETYLNSFPEKKKPRKRRTPTDLAVKMMAKYSLSTNKTAEVLKGLSENGIEVDAPKQESIWRAAIRKSEKVKEELKERISKEKFCLHFDGKRIKHKEFQVVCLTNEVRELKLGILICESGSAKHIFEPLKKLLDEYDAWNSIQMVVSDTTNVNTGKKGGVVAMLNNIFVNEKKLNKPQYIGCQHHILDTIIKKVLDKYFPIKSQSPNINYSFVDDIVNGYETLKTEYAGEEMMPPYKNPGYRDDFRLLYDLCEAHKFYTMTGKLPIIKWPRKLPSLHNARWNSRGIFALIAYFLLPDLRPDLTRACKFIAGGWSRAWFCDQTFSENRYHDLREAIIEVDSEKALKSFENHWNKNPSKMDVPRTNICAERGVKDMEKVYDTCNELKYINCKFILKNKKL